ncbi:ATP-binding protein [Nocardia aurantia]|uniref:ATP-binding protein n=1 Tax=Nocardia aurantia TaxID=2585199 RepID=A0A7K0DIJ3_9NOCA|nr:ATP-binding protein [Nocardia aurantia]MQY25625.1 hypothetical protein [Nocardia aurantia]
MKYFNTTGPCDPRRHYMLPAAERIAKAREFIDYGQYFVVNAPRQTGKSTSLIELGHELTAGGNYVALHFSCEVAVPFHDDFVGAGKAILNRIRTAAENAGLPSEQLPPDPWPDTTPGTEVVTGLSAWAARCPMPLVLFFDEIDAIRGDSLVSVLQQLRDGYITQRDRFPYAVVLCGMRDIRDYTAVSGGDLTRLRSADPFNIKVASIRIRDFNLAEVAALYEQHTACTGQQFSTRATDLAYSYSEGQPWLVNALAHEVIRKMRVTGTITDEHIDEAKERLIVAHATHLDSLVDKLSEPRVRRVMEPLIAGSVPAVDPTFDDDVAYVRELGLIANDKTIRVANPIYKEVIVRVLGSGIENVIFAQPSNFRLPDGRLDFPKLLAEFVTFWKQNGEVLVVKQGYHEAAAQLVMMAFLHRIVNGGGYIDREYGLGYRRIDLLVRQAYTAADGHRAWQREALELKVRHDGDEDPLIEGLGQLDAYLDRLDLATGVLAIFDRRASAPPLPVRTAFSEAVSPGGRTITVLRA